MRRWLADRFFTWLIGELKLRPMTDEEFAAMLAHMDAVTEEQA